MYLYKIGYHSYENSDYIELYHHNKFTKEEFENIIIDSTLEILISRKDKNNILSFYEEGDYHKGDVEDFESGKYAKDLPHLKDMALNEFLDKYCHQWFTKFYEIYREVIDIMIEKYKFSKVEYTQNISIDGWGEIVNKNRSFGIEDEVLNKIRDKFWEAKNK